MSRASNALNPPLVYLKRGGHVESVHHGAIVLSDADGKILFSMGDIETPIYPRSSIKPFQAIPLVESGAAEKFGFGQRELALACASHSGEEMHVSVVEGMLGRMGVGEEALQCGTHWPLKSAAGRRLVECQCEPTALHNNCSGKHAGLIAVSLHMDHSPAHYTDPDHPVQTYIREVLETCGEDKLGPSRLGIDGCSLPNWAMPLHNLAMSFARFSSGRGLERRRAESCRRLMKACFDEPERMSGTGRFCTKILSRLPHLAYVKDGAEGVYCGAFPDQGLGFSLKIDDGARRAAELVTAHIIAQLIPGARAKLSDLTFKSLKNWRDEEIGSIEPSEALLDEINGS